MRSRETEWTNPLLRFLGALFIPPILGSILIVLSLLFSGELSPAQTLPAVFSNGFRFLIASTVPSIIFFLILEKVYESQEKILISRIRFSVIGLAMGTVFGLGAGIYLKGVPLFLIIGSIVGFATAYLIYPTNAKQGPLSD